MSRFCPLSAEIGRGFNQAAADFGTQGTKPTHPELLDFLASELIDHDWSTHHIHRLILGSATYCQSSQASASALENDPLNTAYSRWEPRRLEAEAIRDSILAVAGSLSRRAGGPSVAQPSKHRSIYLNQRRDNLPNQQTLFDGEAAIVSCSRRRVSTTPLQPLWLMNSEFTQQAAAQLARRSNDVRTAFLTAIGREPSEIEIHTLTALASDHGLQSACLAILNSSEFLYLP